jgi:hypothetical protein
VRRLVHGLARQADHELGLVALLAKELVQDERADETARLVTTHAKRTPDSVAQQFRRVAWRARARLCQVACKTWERHLLDVAPDTHIGTPDPNGKLDLWAERKA